MWNVTLFEVTRTTAYNAAAFIWVIIFVYIYVYQQVKRKFRSFKNPFEVSEIFLVSINTSFQKMPKMDSETVQLTFSVVRNMKEFCS
eukprot:UN01505